MGWMQKCIETYDSNLHMVGKIVEGKSPLSPLYFISQKAQIEVTLTEDGGFYDAKAIPKEDAETLIPATEKSAIRSSGVAAHPLCDQLQYVVLGHDTCGLKKYRKHYEAYIKELGAWAQSEHSHYIVRAVYRYCQKGSLLSDLARAGIIELDEDGRLLTGKISGSEYEKCLVRWRVMKPGQAGGEAWQDKTLFESYVRYFSSASSASKDVCYATGDYAAAAENHPVGIIKNPYKAKLISANDSSNFTYRGRFVSPSEALAVGMESSQKAHAALRWLAANQGVYYGGRTFVCWNPKGKKVPQPDAFAFFGLQEEETLAMPLSMPQYRQKLKNALAGYKNELGDTDDVVIMALDAATTGRLSITYYNELRASDFLDRLEKWYGTFCWYFPSFDSERKFCLAVMTPSTKRVVGYAFGTQRGEIVEADDKVVKEHSQRLLHCIIDDQPIPRDIVQALVRRTAMRQAYTRGNYERLLSTACAAVRKYENDRKGSEECAMELDLNNKDRSYLFGRLLAVAEKVERSTYSASETDREPNAIRLQAEYVRRPMHTWAIIEKALIPYYAKLRPGSRKFYKDLIGEIVSTLEEKDAGELNRPLRDVYLLGYYLQRKELNNYKVKENKEEEEHDAQK